MNGYLLDTHVFVWILLQLHEEVSPNFFSEVDEWQRERILFVSPLTLWEIGLLVKLGRLKLPVSPEVLWQEGTGDGSIAILPLSPEALLESTRLPEYENRDPADRLLIATARLTGLTLVTRDKHILPYAKRGRFGVRKP